jgi:hypothetical protein
MNRLNLSKKRKNNNFFSFLNKEEVPSLEFLSVKDKVSEKVDDIPMRPKYKMKGGNDKDRQRLKNLSKAKYQILNNPAEHTLKEYIDATEGKKKKTDEDGVGYNLLKKLKK